jgi:hypothetical protein
MTTSTVGKSKHNKLIDCYCKTNESYSDWISDHFIKIINMKSTYSTNTRANTYHTTSGTSSYNINDDLLLTYNNMNNEART